MRALRSHFAAGRLDREELERRIELAYRAVSRGKRIISEPTRKAMKEVLGEIQSGEFAREWIAENRAGQENFKRMREEQQNTQIERQGRELRSMMDWIDTEF